jgi:histidine triad (HIT) family protein
MKRNCIFCEIVKGVAPAFIITESRHAIAILPKKMEVKGHALVIPRCHFRNIFDIPDQVLGEVMKMVRAVSLNLQLNLGADGINILHASGVAAQQSVEHFHVHVIPRFEGDSIDAWPDFPGCEMMPVEVLKLVNG